LTKSTVEDDMDLVRMFHGGHGHSRARA
jgi:hypothetical protein